MKNLNLISDLGPTRPRAEKTCAIKTYRDKSLWSGKKLRNLINWNGWPFFLKLGVVPLSTQYNKVMETICKSGQNQFFNLLRRIKLPKHFVKNRRFFNIYQNKIYHWFNSFLSFLITCMILIRVLYKHSNFICHRRLNLCLNKCLCLTLIAK